MTGTNIPEGYRRALESLTSGDYGKLRDQAGILADARLHHLCHSCATQSNFYEISSVFRNCEFLYPIVLEYLAKYFPQSPQSA